MQTQPPDKRTPHFRFAQPADVSAVHALIERAYRGPETAGQWDSESHLLQGPRTTAAYIAERIAAPLALRPRAFWSNARDLVRLNRFLQTQSTRYPRIKRPLLVMHGQDDAVVPFWNHGERLTALLPDAEVQLLPGLGHAPHHVAPDDIAERIAAFARRCHASSADTVVQAGGGR